MWGITLENGLPVMTFSGGSDLLTNVILSLEISQGSFFLDPGFGLKKRARMKNTDRTARLIQGDVRDALKWLVDTGRAAAIAVVMELDTLQDRTRLKAAITVTGASGETVTYDKFTEVV